MANRVDNSIWKEYIDNFSSYEGTVTGFCKENNISKSQFYYHKKRFEVANKPIFHAIALNKEESNDTVNISLVSKDIRIEIGKASIYIPANEIALFSDVIRELAKIC
jgi:hypothetical protein